MKQSQIKTLKVPNAVLTYKLEMLTQRQYKTGNFAWGWQWPTFFCFDQVNGQYLNLHEGLKQKSQDANLKKSAFFFSDYIFV